MAWFFGAMLFTPIILLALAIMRADLVLYFFNRDDEDRPDE